MNQEIPMTLSESKRMVRRKEITAKTVAYFFLVLGALTMILPFLWMITTSLKELDAIYIQPKNWVQMFIPTTLIWQNYVKAFEVVPFARFYLNSVFVAICVTAGQVFTSSLAAYAFARISFPLKALFLKFKLTVNPGT